MRTTTFATVGAVGLVDWLKQLTTPRYSLAIGANCGCDVSRLGRDVSDYLNRRDPSAGSRCRAFDAEEIRQLAGDPFWRQSVLAAAAQGMKDEFYCDFEAMTRGIAALGGAVLSGETAIETTASLGNVFRVSLSHCDRCCPQTELILNPDGFTHEGLAAVIAKRFVQWSERKATRKPAESRDTVFA